MPWYKYLLSLTFLFIATLNLFSQNESNSVNHQLWLDYNPAVILNSQTSIYGDISARTTNDRDWNRLISRVNVNYKPFLLLEKVLVIKTMQFHAGVGDFYTFYTSDTNLNEIRLMQGVRVYWPYKKKARVSHYVRLEERFEKLSYDNDIHFSARLRYKLQSKFRFSKPYLSSLYFPISIEFFVPFGDGIAYNADIRLTPAAGFDFADSFRAEFHFSYNISRDSREASYSQDNLVYRFRIFQIF